VVAPAPDLLVIAGKRLQQSNLPVALRRYSAIFRCSKQKNQIVCHLPRAYRSPQSARRLRRFLLSALQAADIQRKPAQIGDADLIIVDGPLAPGDESVFADIATTSKNAVVLLSSQGGSLDAGLGIGRDIRLKRFATAVAPDTDCIVSSGRTPSIASHSRSGYRRSSHRPSARWSERAPHELTGRPTESGGLVG
jgi:hypothetical protein